MKTCDFCNKEYEDNKIEVYFYIGKNIKFGCTSCISEIGYCAICHGNKNVTIGDYVITCRICMGSGLDVNHIRYQAMLDKVDRKSFSNNMPLVQKRNF